MASDQILTADERLTRHKQEIPSGHPDYEPMCDVCSACFEPWPCTVEALRAERAALRGLLRTVHEAKVALTKSCFLDDDVRASASGHPGWKAWSDAYNSLFDINTHWEEVP